MLAGIAPGWRGAGGGEQLVFKPNVLHTVILSQVISGVQTGVKDREHTVLTVWSARSLNIVDVDVSPSELKSSTRTSRAGT